METAVRERERTGTVILSRPNGSDPVRRAPGSSKLAIADKRFGIVLTLPAVVLFVVVCIVPLGSSIVNSFFHESLLLPGKTFAGANNYSAIIGEFWARLGTTMTFSVLATVASVLLGGVLGILLNARLAGRNILRGFMMLPWLLPGVVVAFLWAWIFNDQYGVINYLLGLVGLPGVDFLSSPAGAMFAVVLAKTWNSFPWIMVVVLAAMQSISTEQLEAAALDGATRRKRFWYISWPHLIGPVALVSILEFIYNFGNFDTIYVMTGGGPGSSTTTLAVDLYNLAFQQYNIGAASALGVLWLILLGAVASIYLVVNRRLENQ
jgi:multiple sugar transport system permease protein